ncbi:MAG: gas vesicle protein K [Deltaproteobacteria bacterium]|nr:gas vesicle protein K [Deltaproteobacteria bacterium]
MRGFSASAGGTRRKGTSRCTGRGRGGRTHRGHVAEVALQVKKINAIEGAPIAEFADAFRETDLSARHPQRRHLELDPDDVKNGLGQLVLTLVKLLHELLERQAIRRMESGSLTEEQIDRIGFTLMRQAEEIDRLCKGFGLQEEDLNLDLGPLGRLL